MSGVKRELGQHFRAGVAACLFNRLLHTKQYSPPKVKTSTRVSGSMGNCTSLLPSQTPCDTLFADTSQLPSKMQTCMETATFTSSKQIVCASHVPEQLTGSHAHAHYVFRREQSLKFLSPCLLRSGDFVACLYMN